MGCCGCYGLLWLLWDAVGSMGCCGLVWAAVGWYGSRAGERNRGYALLMTANKPERVLYRAPTFSLLVLHGGVIVFPRIVRARSINFTFCVMRGQFEGALYLRARFN